MAPGPLFGVHAMRALEASNAARVKDVPARHCGGLGRPGLARGALLAAALVSLLVVYLFTAARASAEWTPPFDLSLAAGNAGSPQVAVDPSGGAIAVWSASDGASDGIQGRRIDASGTLGPIQHVTAVGERGDSPQVAVDAAGNATVVWIDFGTPDGRVRARRITAAGLLEDVNDVSPVTQSAGDPQVAVDPFGNATVVWSAFDGTTDVVYARRIGPAGGIGPVVAVSSPGEVAFRQQVAVDPDGNAVIAWQGVTGPDSRARARMLDADGQLRAIVTLSAPGEIAFSPRVAFDGSGNLTGAWKRSDGTIQARRGTPGGELGAIGDLSYPDVHTDPQLAVDPSGQATVVWAGFDGFNEVVELRQIGPGGPVGEIQRLSAGGEDSEPQVAVDALGNTTVVWLHRGEAGFTVQSRTVTAGGQLGPTGDLTPASEEIVTPRLATHPSGSATAVWSRYDGSRYVVAGAHLLVPSPTEPTPPAPTPPVPAAPAAALPELAPSPPAGCPTVTLAKLQPYTAGQPTSKRKRTKGVGAKLTLDRGARLQLLATTLSYTWRGKGRTVKLKTRRLRTVDRQSKLRLKLPGNVRPRIGLGARVTLRLKLRARSTGAGCTFGKAQNRKIRTKLIWVATSSEPS